MNEIMYDLIEDELEGLVDDDAEEMSDAIDDLTFGDSEYDGDAIDRCENREKYNPYTEEEE